MKQSPPLKVIQKLWPQIHPFRHRLLLGIGLIMLTTGLDLLGPVFIGKAADIVVSESPNYQELTWTCFIFLMLVSFKSLSEMAQAFTIQTTGLLITQQLRLSVFERMLRLPLSFYDENSSGRLITRVINDVRSLSELFTASMSVLALDVMIIIGTLIAMLVMDWKLASLVLVTFPIVVWVILHFGDRLSSAYQEARSRLSEINGFLGENIAAMTTIHRLGAETERQKSFDGIVERHQGALIKSIQAYAQVQPWANVLNGIAMGTLMGVGGMWVIQGKIKVGVLVAFFAYIRNLFQPIRDLVEKYNVVLSAMVSADRVSKVFEEKPEESESGLVPELSIPTPCGVRFEKVEFSYPNRNEKALSGVSFNLEPGKTLAIVGATGSGKSTLAKLLLRFYDVSAGHIWLGEIPIQKWPRKTLRKHVGFIPQDVYLFEGTIRDNLCLSQPGVSDDLLIEQCRKAQLWDSIQNRGGLDLKIEEGGNNLSLGEKQLLSFARMLVINPEILVMDEATASLDNASEGRLMKAVDELLQGRTALIIAHRLSTIENCDQVIVLEKGELREQGTFESLIRQKGLFERIYRLYQESSLKTEIKTDT